jgi:hypothetical protein
VDDEPIPQQRIAGLGERVIRKFRHDMKLTLWWFERWKMKTLGNALLGPSPHRTSINLLQGMHNTNFGGSHLGTSAEAFTLLT